MDVLRSIQTLPHGCCFYQQFTGSILYFKNPQVIGSKHD